MEDGRWKMADGRWQKAIAGNLRLYWNKVSCYIYFAVLLLFCFFIDEAKHFSKDLSLFFDLQTDLHHLSLENNSRRFLGSKSKIF